MVISDNKGKGLEYRQGIQWTVIEITLLLQRDYPSPIPLSRKDCSNNSLRHTHTSLSLTKEMGLYPFQQILQAVLLTAQCHLLLYATQGKKKARNLLEERCLVYSHLLLVSWLQVFPPPNLTVNSYLLHVTLEEGLSPTRIVSEREKRD